MEKESHYELQLIDCNCNNCGYMVRDLRMWRQWHDWHKMMETADFDKRKAKAILEAEVIQDEKMRAGMLYKARKMYFLFDKTKLLNYGKCAKFNMQVSFLPDTCQVHTQKCFIHRKDYIHEESKS